MALVVWLLVFQPLLMHCGTGSALRSLLCELVDLFCSLDLKLKTPFRTPYFHHFKFSMHCSPVTAAPARLLALQTALLPL